MFKKLMVLSALVLTVVLSPAWADDSGLIGYWNFDDNTTNDLSGTGNDGLLEGGAILSDQAGFVYGGSGLSLDLNFSTEQEYLRVAHSASFETIVDELSIAMWIRPDRIDNYDGMVCKSDMQADPVPWAIDFDDANHPNFRVNRNIDPNTGAIGEGTFTADTEVIPGEWTFVGFTSNGSQVAFVVNDEVTSDQILYRFGPGTDDLLIGADLPGGDEYFNGLMDEIKIYNTALTTRELIAMSGKASKPFGPDPADGQIAVTSGTLTWGTVAGSEKVYVGTDPNALGLAAEGTSGSYTIADLVAEQVYCWRVDVDGVAGDVWSFTAAGLSPVVLSPEDGYPFAPAGDVTLAWLGALGASGYKVNFGTDMANLALLEETVQTSVTATGLVPATQYYWRVDAVINGETIEGAVWSFKTEREIGGLVGEYRQDKTGASNSDEWFLSPAYKFTMAPTAIRLDEEINFGWGSPDGVGPNWYTVRWRGKLEIPYAGTWTLIAGNRDDGTRIYLNDVLVLDQWDTGSGEDSEVTVDIPEAGIYPLRFEYYQQQYGRSINFSWEHDRIARAIVPKGALIPEFSADPIAPQIGAENVATATSLQWIPVVWDGASEVYLGTDADAVANATKASPEHQGGATGSTYQVSDLALGTVYYWRIDSADADGVMVKGRVWSFSTAPYVVLDDFEGYSTQEGEEVWQQWVDGLGSNGDGSNGNGSGAYAGSIEDASFGETEKVLVHNGLQALGLNYDLSGTIQGWDLDTGAVIDISVANYGEINKVFVEPQNFLTMEGLDLQALSVSYHGRPRWARTYDPETGVYHLTGPGRDIWTVNLGTEEQEDDEFIYLYTRITGDGEMVARLDERIWHTPDRNNASQMGVMFREDFDPNSMFAMSSITTNGRMLYRYRHTKGDRVYQTWNNSSVGGFKELPIMLKIVRAGNSFTAFMSEDEGETWVQRDTAQEIPMSETVYIGLAVCPHVGGGKATLEGIFSNVSITGNIEQALPLDQGVVIGEPAMFNHEAPVYVALEDVAGNRAVAMSDDTAATRAHDWVDWVIKYDVFTGIDLTQVKSLTVGVGNPAEPQAGSIGELIIDDIRLYDASFVNGQ